MSDVLEEQALKKITDIAANRDKQLKLAETNIESLVTELKATTKKTLAVLVAKIKTDGAERLEIIRKYSQRGIDTWKKVLTEAATAKAKAAETAADADSVEEASVADQLVET